MKSLLTILVVVGFVATGAYGVAGQDSTTWAGSYEADVLPDADGFAVAYPGSVPDTPDVSVASSVLSFTSPPRFGGYINHGSISPDQNLGYSFEIRAKVDAAPTTNIFSIQLGSTNHTFNLTRNRGENGHSDPYVWLRFGSNADVSLSALSSEIDPTEYHTYRYTIQDLGPVDDNLDAKLYIDDNPIPVDEAFSAAAGAWSPWGKDRFFMFPDAGQDTRTTEIDWIRWTDEGAFAPVPEPASLLILTGGLLALARRRR